MLPPMTPLSWSLTLEPTGWGSSSVLELEADPLPTTIRWAGGGNQVVTVLTRFERWAGLVLAEPVSPVDEVTLEVTGTPGRPVVRLVPEGRTRSPVWPARWRDVAESMRNEAIGDPTRDRLVELEKRSLLPGLALARIEPPLREELRAARLFWHVDTRVHPVIVRQRNPEGFRENAPPRRGARLSLPGAHHPARVPPDPAPGTPRRGRARSRSGTSPARAGAHLGVPGPRLRRLVPPRPRPSRGTGQGCAR
jgi:hypothetical protein